MKTPSLALLALLLTAGVSSLRAQDGKVPLTTAFPPPLTIGTPGPIKLPNL